MCAIEPAIVTVDGEVVRRVAQRGQSERIPFIPWDNGTVYTALAADRSPLRVWGLVHPCGDIRVEPAHIQTDTGDEVLLVVGSADMLDKSGVDMAKQYVVKGYVRLNGHWREANVQVVPVREDIFSRSRGILETDILADEVVLVFGLGSGGSGVVRLLVQSGFCQYIIVDHDRLDVGPSLRHDAGVSHVGRYKTKYEADLIHDKNPYASVETYEVKVTKQTVSLVRKLVRKSTLVIAAIDDEEGKGIINRVCVREGKTCIFPSVFRRGYGGQILCARPNVDPCYQCFLSIFPRKKQDIEVSNQEQAEELGYSDEPVAIEPGLAADVAPINVMVVKLAIQESLRDKVTTLRSLDEDLSAPWYLYLNRREPGTQYENLKPLCSDGDGFRVLRWCPIDLPRNPHCPVCGDYAAHLAKTHGVSVTDEEIQAMSRLLKRKGPKISE